jgi:tRNA-2-methylthio-N6-dimethylallyladenosine synthase
MQKSVFIYTYGCQMNEHDSEKMLGVLSEGGYERARSPEDADLIILNTCAIREKAEQKFFSQLGRLKRLKQKRSDLKIAVAGCVAQEEKEKLFRRVPIVDFIIGPQNIQSLSVAVSGKGPAAVLDENLELAESEFEAVRLNNVKAWVSIMYGCNNFCSYCIVPFTRGREVSRPSSSVLSEISALAARGFREITLLGQNVNSYRSDIDFIELLRRIDLLGIERVRFVTSHPRDLSEALIGVIAELKSVCEHVHLPLQSGSNRILALMNRRYTYDDYRRKIDLLRKAVPGIAITTDIIAGFPGESEEDHSDTLRALEDIEYDGAFAFKFSPRKGTKASEMEDTVPKDIKSARLERILKMQENITFDKNKMLEGRTVEILLEGPSDTDPGKLVGRTRTNKIVVIPDSMETKGSIVKVRIENARPHSLYGINTKATGQRE